MNEEKFIRFVKDMDQCWLENRFKDLAQFLADDVVVVAPDGKQRVQGVDEAIDSYRQFMLHAQVERFLSSGHITTQRGETSVVEYQWQMTWTMAGEKHDDAGREVLVLAHRDDLWRVVWRTQISAS